MSKKKKSDTIIRGEREKEKTYDEKKKDALGDLDYLRQVDVPINMGGGRDFVIKEIEEGRKQEQDTDNDIKNYLQGKGAVEYRRTLANYVLDKLTYLDWPKGWSYDVVPTGGSPITIQRRTFSTKPGVVVIVITNKKDVLMRAVRTSYDVDVDFGAMRMLAVQAENTIDSAKGILLSDNVDTHSTLKQTKSGIVLPS